jgi:hypothetical protein
MRSPYSILCFRDADGGGRGPRTNPTLSRANEEVGLESFAGSFDDPIQAGTEGLSSANLGTAIFAEGTEFELFRDLELRFDLGLRFDFELNKDVERENCSLPFGSVDPGCDVSSLVVGYADTLDIHD